MDLAQKTLEIISNVSGKDASSLERGMNLMADLGIDSPKSLQLLMDLEDNLKIEIGDEDAARLETVGDILDFVGSVA